MERNVASTAALILAVLFGLALVAVGTGRLLPRDELADVAAVYADYLPGAPVPAGAHCNATTEYYPSAGYFTYCTPPATQYCGHGWASTREGQITYLSLWRCRFPLAYLTSRYGHWTRAFRYGRSARLVWVEAGVSATLRDRQFDLQSDVYWMSFFGSESR